MDISVLRERRGGDAMTVGELNEYIKGVIDRDDVLRAVSVTGEISNLTDHRSGHLYFTLKDGTAQIKAVMFRSSRARLKFAVEDGMKVTVHGSVSVYTQSGAVQLYATTMAPEGVGSLYKAYEQLKARLAGEGLFDAAHKKPIPRYPTKIGVITSPTGAAVRDIINVTGRRFPLATVYLYPSLVQGEGAEANLISALDYFDKSKLVDLVIIGRGGGSIEDLWAFNSEALARRIFAASVPVISAVGHETDFTICDFVADLRAPTPSAAAELSVPDIRELALALDDTYTRISSALVRVTERQRERLSRVKDRPLFTDSDYLIGKARDRLSSSEEKISLFMREKISGLDSRLKIIAGRADALSPLAVLSRGYSITEQGGKRISSVGSLSVGEGVSVVLSDGKIEAEIKAIKKK